MQHSGVDLISVVKKFKMQKLESEMKEAVLAEGAGHLFICPFCNYSSPKNSKGSAKVFDTDGLIFKCFNCGIWREI